MRHTRKLDLLLERLRSQGERPAFSSHQEAYWHAALQGLAYTAAKGWHEPQPRRGARRVGVRLEGDFRDVVAVELLLREAGHVPADRRGPDRGNGDSWLIYLALPLPPMARAPVVRRRS